jgi:hypothetical protein
MTVCLKILVFSQFMIMLPLDLLPVKLPNSLEHSLGFESPGMLVRVDWLMVPDGVLWGSATTHNTVDP